MWEYRGYRLDKETILEKKDRFDDIHDGLSCGTPEQRTRRLGVIHARLSNETSEQRTHWLSVKHDRLSNEVEEARSNRLQNISQNYHSPRKINEESFKTSINVFANVSCTTCRKSLYPQQRFSLCLKQFASILPPDLMAKR